MGGLPDYFYGTHQWIQARINQHLDWHCVALFISVPMSSLPHAILTRFLHLQCPTTGSATLMSPAILVSETTPPPSIASTSAVLTRNASPSTTTRPRSGATSPSARSPTWSLLAMANSLLVTASASLTLEMVLGTTQDSTVAKSKYHLNNTLPFLYEPL